MSDKDENKVVGRPFTTGEDDRRNVTGANKGSKWKGTLLKDLMTMDLSTAEMDSFKEFSEKFPSFFSDDNNDKNFQLFMELKQMSLVFHKDAKVSQSAISAIKDRIEGKPQQHVDHTTVGMPVTWNEQKTYEANNKTDTGT